MFGRQQPEPKKSNPPDLQDILVSPQTDREEGKQLEPQVDIQVDIEKPQIVNLVEKISGILSPYFIVLVGLYLYDDNFLLGIILITIGMISLLKISTKDVVNFVDWLKNIFGSEK